ncbi:unnamed protein product (macronuclear) [Paramecium tetraurelia]|uniref:Uncharacterized protein n=1 Tax=Paramecium tetraurelia TaxID=5888 RepID=A0C3F6_PARTE|nr:uncharacterized protein GSPATT00034802001 [Paramecium tetraurelia]CAK65323.1 unnamed protein product [Paramecium tetraurelia]|eukprot:XP_001432720.1 hypothetical protein (macronuclear) [Paramecium tetraurelia strain d4-2]
MKEVIDNSKIVDGKRKRVMSANGVMYVVTKELMREQRTSVPQVQKTVVKKKEKSKEVREKSQCKNDKRVRITKSALRELIQSHFIVVDDDEEAMIQSSKTHWLEIKIDTVHHLILNLILHHHLVIEQGIFDVQIIYIYILNIDYYEQGTNEINSLSEQHGCTNQKKPLINPNIQSNRKFQRIDYKQSQPKTFKALGKVDLGFQPISLLLVRVF